MKSEGATPSLGSRVAVALMVACGVLAFVAWKAKLSTFTELEVSIRGEATAVQVTLARATTLESLQGETVDLGRLTILTAQIRALPAAVNGDGWVRVVGGPLVVKGLRAPADARLSLAWVTAPGASSLVLRGYARGIDGELLVSPRAQVYAGTTNDEAAMGEAMIDEQLDVLSFGCADCGEAPFRLDLKGQAAFAFANVPINRLAFSVEHTQADGTIDFSSALRGGTIRVLEGGHTETIQPGDNLKLDIGRARRFQLGHSARADVLSFVYEGSVKGIALGPPEVESNLSPSLLEYLYREKALTLLWGAAAFLWGLFKSIGGLWKGKAS